LKGKLRDEGHQIIGTPGKGTRKGIRMPQGKSLKGKQPDTNSTGRGGLEQETAAVVHKSENTAYGRGKGRGIERLALLSREALVATIKRKDAKK